MIFLVSGVLLVFLCTGVISGSTDVISGSTGVLAGTTGPSGGTTAGKFRSYFRRPVPLTNFRYWTRAEVAPELASVLPLLPVLPVCPAEVPPRRDEAGSAEPFEDR